MSKELRVAVVAGARPNFMKVAPLLRELERRDIRHNLVHTGQHYDSTMSDVFFDELGIRAPDVNLAVGSGSHAEQVGRLLPKFEQYAAEFKPTTVVVVGDVNSTVACGLVAAKGGMVLAHVEAGLRSREWSMPEEVNRVVTDRLSDLLFAPSPDAVVNLEAEGYAADQIHLVGNVMIDTLFDNLDRADKSTVLDDVGVDADEFALLTLHRPSNVDNPRVLHGILDAVGEISTNLPVVFPVHPRVASNQLLKALPATIRQIKPQGYLDFLALQNRARVVLTDSGGVQEETTALGVPCLTLRNSTERPITVTDGSNTVVGTDPRRIIDAYRGIRPRGTYPRPEMWDGHASKRIVDVLEKRGMPGSGPRPTDIRTQETRK